MVQKVFGICEAKNGTETDELLQTGTPMGPDVDFRRILEETRDEKGCAIFEFFSSDGPSEILVVSK